MLLRRAIRAPASVAACQRTLTTVTLSSSRRALPHSASARPLPLLARSPPLSIVTRHAPLSTSASSSSSAPAAAAAAPASSASPVAGTAPAAASAVVPVTAESTMSRMDKFKRYVEQRQIKIINWSLLSAGAYGCYSIYGAGLSVVDFFLEQRPDDAPFLAFFLGAGATVASAALYRLGRRVFLLRAARTYRTLLRQVWSSYEVKEALGADVRAVTIRRMQRYGRNLAWERAGTPAAASASADSLRVVAPHFRLVSFLPAGPYYRAYKDAWARYWRSRRLQFLFHVQGSKGSAVVCAEVEQSLRGDDTTNTLTVELLEQGQQIVMFRSAQEKPTKRKEDLLSDEDAQQTGVVRGTDILSTTVRKV